MKEKHCGFIIGKGGQSIKALQRQFADLDIKIINNGLEIRGPIQSKKQAVNVIR